MRQNATASDLIERSSGSNSLSLRRNWSQRNLSWWFFISCNQIPPYLLKQSFSITANLRIKPQKMYLCWLKHAHVDSWFFFFPVHTPPPRAQGRVSGNIQHVLADSFGSSISAPLLHTLVPCPVEQARAKHEVCLTKANAASRRRLSEEKWRDERRKQVWKQRRNRTEGVGGGNKKVKCRTWARQSDARSSQS